MPKSPKTSAQYDEELKKLTAKLKKALTSQRAFFADASHQLRTPLTIIKGNLDLIYLEGKKHGINDHILELLDNINTEMKRMNFLLADITFLNAGDVDEFLSVSRPSLKPVGMEQVTEDALKNFQEKAKSRDISLETHLVACEVMGDYDKLKRAIGQIISNAIRYNQPGGKVVISLAPVQKYAVLKITDDGIGINKSDLPYIFDRFYRTSPGRGKALGSGLGLAIARQVIGAHNGKISVKSDAGLGSAFTIKIPLAKTS